MATPTDRTDETKTLARADGPPPNLAVAVEVGELVEPEAITGEVVRERAILYSPGYGGGWTSDHSGPAEEKRFMLEYEPFVRACDARGDRLQYDRSMRDRELPRRRVAMAAVVVGGRVRIVPFEERDLGENWLLLGPEEHDQAVVRHLSLPPGSQVLWTLEGDDIPADLPVEQFLVDWMRRFGPRRPPYLWGLRDLTVTRVPAGSVVRVTQYDGSERVEVRGEDEWL